MEISKFLPMVSVDLHEVFSVGLYLIFSGNYQEYNESNKTTSRRITLEEITSSVMVFLVLYYHPFFFILFNISFVTIFPCLAIYHFDYHAKLQKKQLR